MSVPIHLEGRISIEILPYYADVLFDYYTHIFTIGNRNWNFASAMYGSHALSSVDAMQQSLERIRWPTKTGWIFLLLVNTIETNSGLGNSGHSNGRSPSNQSYPAHQCRHCNKCCWSCKGFLKLCYAWPDIQSTRGTGCRPGFFPGNLLAVRLRIGGLWSALPRKVWFSFAVGNRNLSLAAHPNPSRDRTPEAALNGGDHRR